MGERVLLRGGYVLSMNDEIGELPAADVLVEDGAIAAVATGIDAGGADEVDVSGHVVMPGFVDTHRHTWQSPATTRRSTPTPRFRGCATRGSARSSPTGTTRRRRPSPASPTTTSGWPTLAGSASASCQRTTGS